MTPSLSKKLTGMIGCSFSQGVNETKGVAASMRKLGIIFMFLLPPIEQYLLLKENEISSLPHFKQFYYR